MQGYPGEIWEFRGIGLWVYDPFMRPPEAIYADDNRGRRRESWDGFNISPKYYEFGSPIIGRGPEFMRRRRRHI